MGPRTDGDRRRHVACLLGGGPEDDAALSEALRLRTAGSARLSLIHACPPPATVVSPMGDVWIDDPAEIERGERALLEERARGVEAADLVLLPGPVPHALRDWTRAAGVDLLVAGRPVSRLRRALLGDPSSWARRADCPVVVVGEPRAPRRGRAARTSGAPA